MEMEQTFTRRKFLEGALAGASGLALTHVNPSRGFCQPAPMEIRGSGDRNPFPRIAFAHSPRLLS